MHAPLLPSKLAIITGASRGLGRAIALRYAAEGASIALIARDEEALNQLVPTLVAARISETQRFVPIAADLADPSAIDHAIAACQRELGDIDILVNNAAVQGPIGPFDGNDLQAWRQSFEVNFFAPVRLCQLVIPLMRRRGGGKIVNLSGGGATGPRPDFSAYGAAKCALVRFTETLAAELKPDRIDVNAIAPGAMNTRMLEEVLAAGPNAARAEYAEALRRSQTPGASFDRPAALAAMLGSSLSDGFTGKLLSAVWDDWESLPTNKEAWAKSDLFTLRRISKL